MDSIWKEDYLCQHLCILHFPVKYWQKIKSLRCTSLPSLRADICIAGYFWSMVGIFPDTPETWLLTSHWLRVITWPGCWPLIGLHPWDLACVRWKVNDMKRETMTQITILHSALSTRTKDKCRNPLSYHSHSRSLVEQKNEISLRSYPLPLTLLTAGAGPYLTWCVEIRIHWSSLFDYFVYRPKPVFWCSLRFHCGVFSFI